MSKQEPVAHVIVVGDMVSVSTGSAGLKTLLELGDGAPLYTHPTPEAVQGLFKALELIAQGKKSPPEILATLAEVTLAAYKEANK